MLENWLKFIKLSTNPIGLCLAFNGTLWESWTGSSRGQKRHARHSQLRILSWALHMDRMLLWLWNWKDNSPKQKLSRTTRIPKEAGPIRVELGKLFIIFDVLWANSFCRINSEKKVKFNQKKEVKRIHSAFEVVSNWNNFPLISFWAWPVLPHLCILGAPSQRFQFPRKSTRIRSRPSRTRWEWQNSPCDCWNSRGGMWYQTPKL